MAAARARATLFAAAAAAAAAAANICGSNATIGAAVVAALNLTYPGLEAVAAAASRGDLGGACDALAAYYAASNTTWWQRVPPVTPGSGMAGGAVDAIVLNDTFYLSGVTTRARVPRNADGGLDWLNKGPRVDVEFMNCLNRWGRAARGAGYGSAGGRLSVVQRRSWSQTRPAPSPRRFQAR